MEYRDVQEEMQKQQADIAITDVKIETESRRIVDGIKELEKDMVYAPEGTLWLPQIQELRDRAEVLQGEAEKLNVQLETERETNERLIAKFNAYESSRDRVMSEWDTDIVVLKVENGKVKRKRNTLFASIITAVSVIVLYLVFTILRRLKIIPF